MNFTNSSDARVGETKFASTMYVAMPINIPPENKLCRKKHIKCKVLHWIILKKKLIKVR